MFCICFRGSRIVYYFSSQSGSCGMLYSLIMSLSVGSQEETIFYRTSLGRHLSSKYMKLVGNFH